MKNYIYISDTKVDMLFSQIPKNTIRTLANKLDIDLSFLGIGAKISFKDNQQEETRYSKLRIVLDYIGKNRSIGTIDEPSTYFTGNIPMRWGTFDNKQGTVIFGGWTDHTICLLGGSVHHMIGQEVKDQKSKTLSIMSLLVQMVDLYILKKHGLNNDQHRVMEEYWSQHHLENFKDEIGKSANNLMSFAAVEYVSLITRRMPMDSSLEFVAVKHKSISTSPFNRPFFHNREHPSIRSPYEAYSEQFGDLNNKRVLIGSPLYVALADW